MSGMLKGFILRAGILEFRIFIKSFGVRGMNGIAGLWGLARTLERGSGYLPTNGFFD
jgi:hypothetical protein